MVTLNTESQLLMRQRSSLANFELMKSNPSVTIAEPQKGAFRNRIIGEWTILDDNSIDGEQYLRSYNEDNNSAGHYFWNYRSSHDDTPSSFVYCHRTRLLLQIINTGAIPTTAVKEMLNAATFTDKDDIDHRMALLFLRRYQSRVRLKKQLAKSYAVNASYEKSFLRALVDVDYIVSQQG